MNFIDLDTTRFAQIPCIPVQTKTFLYNPFLIDKALLALKIINQEDDHSIYADEESWKTLIANLCYSPVQIPKLKDKDNFDKFMADKTILSTELFSPEWKRMIGSARHLNIGPVQFKGCGLALPLPQYDYHNASGTLELHLAIKSFIYSYLMNSTLPLGSNRALSVQTTDWGTDEMPLGLYAREIISPRLAQIGSPRNEHELDYLKEHLKDSFGKFSPREMIYLTLYQYAAMFYLCGRGNGTPDNVLLNGKSIDEETWSWPTVLGELNIFLDFQIKDDNSEPIDIQTFPLEEAELKISSYQAQLKAIENLIEAYKIIFPTADLPDSNEAQQIFIEHLERLAPQEDIHELWKGFKDLLTNYSPNKIKIWIKKMELNGWKFQLQNLESSHIGLVGIKKQQTHQVGISSSFNARPRKSFLSVIKKLEMISNGDTIPLKICDDLFRLIGDSGYVLPYKVCGNELLPNETPLQDYWEQEKKKWPLLENSDVTLVGFDGEKEILINQSEFDKYFGKDFIPLYFTTKKLGLKEHVLPAYKTLIKSLSF